MTRAIMPTMLTYRRLVVAITFIAIFAMAAKVSADADTWWHLRAGAWIMEHRAVPRVDPFSHTRAGAAWEYPGWLAQVVIYAAYAWLGYAGLNLFTAASVTLAFVFVYRACDGPPVLRAFALILAAAASAIYWSARPQIVSFALTGAFALILHEFRWRGVNRLWVLVPLMALWANVHGGFAIGFILMGLTLASQLLSLGARRLGRQAAPGEGDVSGRGMLWLAGVGLACAAAVAVNPSGPAMLLYPFKTVSIGVLRDFIQEWQSPDFHELRAQTFLWLLFAAVAAMALSPRRANLPDLALVCGASYLGLLAWRNAPLLAIVAPPVITRHVTAAWEARRARIPQPAPAGRAVPLNWVVLLIVSLAALVKAGFYLQPGVNQAELARTLPLGAADYVRRERPPGQLFNSYNFGGYLAWALYPDYPVYVDGRTDLYDDAFLREYLRTALGQPGYAATLDRYGVNLVIVEPQSPLADRLRQEGDWLAAYTDATAVVFRRAHAP